MLVSYALQQFEYGRHDVMLSNSSPASHALVTCYATPCQHMFYSSASTHCLFCTASLVSACISKNLKTRVAAAWFNTLQEI